MDHVAINLLPNEAVLQKSKGLRLTLGSKVSIILLVVVGLITAGIMIARIAQNATQKSIEQRLAVATNELTSFKKRESDLIVLKQHLRTIQGLADGDSAKRLLFNMLVLNTPVDLTISSLSLDMQGNATLQANTSSLVSVEEFIQNLTKPENTENLIQKVSLEKLSLDKDQIYRVNLKLLK